LLLHGQLLAVGSQMPLTQLSPVVQARPSLQVPPWLPTGLEQTPEAASQLTDSWHWVTAGQSLAVVHEQPDVSPAVHTPARHTSLVVQARLSWQGVWSGCLGWSHRPSAGLQVPTR